MINIKNELNKRDSQSDNQYDLLNTFYQNKYTKEQKKKLAEALNNNADNKVIHNILTESLNDELKEAVIDCLDWLILFDIEFPQDSFLAYSWKDLKTGIKVGIDSEFEVAEGLKAFFEQLIKTNSEDEDELFSAEKELYDHLVHEMNHYLKANGYRPFAESLNESFEDEYDDSYVEFVDGKPTMAYETYADAKRGVRYDKMAEATYDDMGFHEYNIKYLKDGKYSDIDNDGNIIESLNESEEELSWVITYGKGRPGGNIETINAKTYNDAFRYAADHADGWGFEIKRADNSLEEGAEGKREKNWEYVLVDVTDTEEDAPVVAKRSTKVEADYAQIYGLNKKKFENRELIVRRVPKGMFKVGDVYDAYNLDDDYFKDNFDESLNEGALVEPTDEDLRPLEDLFAQLGLEIEGKGKTLFGRIHYQLRKDLDRDVVESDLREIADALNDIYDRDMPITYSIGVHRDGHNVISAAVDVSEKWDENATDVDESLDEAWDDEAFFTRDDLNEFVDALQDDIRDVNFERAYFEPGNILEVDWEYRWYEETTKVKVDMRKIHYVSDLQRVYLPIVKEMILDRAEEIDEELDGYESGFYDIDKTIDSLGESVSDNKISNISYEEAEKLYSDADVGTLIRMDTHSSGDYVGEYKKISDTEWEGQQKYKSRYKAPANVKTAKGFAMQVVGNDIRFIFDN